MMISTRGRYALRFMVDLAEQQAGLGDEGQEKVRFIPMKEISDRQEVSQKYAERLFSVLSRNHLVDAQHGKGGGYRLSRAPSDYRVSEILRVMDEELAPVACLACPPGRPHGSGKFDGCHRAGDCRTLPMWKKLDGMINDFFDGITLADLMNREEAQDTSSGGSPKAPERRPGARRTRQGS